MPHLLLACVLCFSKTHLNSNCVSTHTYPRQKDIKTSMSQINSIFISKDNELNGWNNTDNLEPGTSK